LTNGDETLAIATASERLRQLQETFNQRRSQDARWFAMRLAMGWLATLLLPAIFAVCVMIIFAQESHSSTTVSAAAGALFVDVVGVVISVWKIVFSSGLPTRLEPTIASASVPQMKD
jgi:drug/metabolite transporter superfamily protein YnfA